MLMIAIGLEKTPVSTFGGEGCTRCTRSFSSPATARQEFASFAAHLPERGRPLCPRLGSESLANAVTTLQLEQTTCAFKQPARRVFAVVQSCIWYEIDDASALSARWTEFCSEMLPARL